MKNIIVMTLSVNMLNTISIFEFIGLGIFLLGVLIFFIIEDIKIA